MKKIIYGMKSIMNEKNKTKPTVSDLTISDI